MVGPSGAGRRLGCRRTADGSGFEGPSIEVTRENRCRPRPWTSRSPRAVPKTPRWDGFGRRHRVDDGACGCDARTPSETTPTPPACWSPDAADVADATCTVSTVADYCAALPPLSAAPIIDGVLDCGPALVAIAPLSTGNGPPPLPPFPAGNATARARGGLAPRTVLYVFVNVTTPARLSRRNAPTRSSTVGAGVEIFVDDDGVYASAPTYDDPGAIQLVVAAPARRRRAAGRRAEGFRNAADEGPWASHAVRHLPFPDGVRARGFHRRRGPWPRELDARRRRHDRLRRVDRCLVHDGGHDGTARPSCGPVFLPRGGAGRRRGDDHDAVSRSTGLLHAFTRVAMRAASPRWPLPSSAPRRPDEDPSTRRGPGEASSAT